MVESVNQAELVLLQFIALALPAVAILLQAVARFHDDLEAATAGFWTEIRLLQYSFYGLVIAGGFFAIPIYSNTNSVFVKAGLLVSGLALFFLIPATWVGLRRGRYGSSKYDSPEQEAWAKIKVGIAVIGGIVLLSGSIYFSTTIFLPELFELLQSELITVSVILVIAAISLASLQFVEIFLRYARRRREIEIWKSQITDQATKILGILDHFKDGVPDPTDLRELRTKVRNRLDRWNELREKVLESIHSGVEDSIDEVSQQLAIILDIIQEIMDVHEDEVAFVGRKEDLKMEYSELASELDAIDTEGGQNQRDEIEEIQNRLREIDTMMENAETKISRARARYDELYTELFEIQSDLQTNLQTILGEFPTDE